ncbi:MAG: tyrosine-type recombinase/integrase [Kofleriaceae bacterium]
MPVRRDPKTGRWFFRTTVKLPDGSKRRLSGTPGVPGPYHDLAQSRGGAMEAEQRAIREACAPKIEPLIKKEVPTFSEWFDGRFTREWVVARRNKPTEVKSKEYIYEGHLKPAFGPLPLDQIGAGEIAAFRALLVDKKLSDKRINNILAVLSKALRYALDCELIAKVPKVGLVKVERPEIEPWDFEQYARLLASAEVEGPDWYVAACLAGEGGLRSGEIKALRRREDVDLIATTITVNTQTCYGITTTPKGRTRRTIPMTSVLEDALLRLDDGWEGYVVRNRDGSQKTDGQANAAILRICRRAGLPEKRWHTLRHTFGTHAALYGVNPWRLQSWMGHKRIDETMLYVHVAENHRREIPEAVLAAGDSVRDPDKRILAMLSARRHATPPQASRPHAVPPGAAAPRGSHVAAEGA